MEPRHWYLMALGVDPAEQGKGRGRKLLLAGLRRADSSGGPCYLETNTEESAAFYSRRGFDVVGSGNLPDAGPPYWCMRRPPRNRA
jgi:GNAT superfamily N-acetyltransferase